MRVLFYLLVTHKLLRERFMSDFQQILHVGSLADHAIDPIAFDSRALDPRGITDAATFERLLLDDAALESAGGILVLTDRAGEHLLKNVRDALFVGVVNVPDYVSNVQNTLSRWTTRLTKNVLHLMQIVRSATEYQATILPLRNFHADELREFARLCREDALDPALVRNLTPSLRLLLKRRGPKRRSEYPDRHFRDDAGMYFRYGHERHARFETGEPHQPHCHVSGLFRFGYRLEPDRHFNVSYEDGEKVRTSMPNCHDESVEAADRSHLNMFSNDFHK